MKKSGIISIAVALALLLSACGAAGPAQSAAATPAPTLSAVSEESDDVELNLIQIGFSLQGEGAFHDQLAADIEAGCTARGYTYSLLTADSAERQITDITSFLSQGVSAIVIEPVDVDALESVLADCETDGVPVINIIDSINGIVSTLISPDYKAIGQSAGQRAVDLFGETGGRCLELKTDYGSFIMQLLSDGFAKEVSADAEMAIVSEQYCGKDEEQAYLLTKTELLSKEKNIDFVFAQSAALAYGAARAVKEVGADVKLVVFGGDMELIAAVADGTIDTAVFIGPAELAKLTLDNAGQFLSDPAFVPVPYLPLAVDVVTAENVAEYNVEGALHAQVKSE